MKLSPEEVKKIAHLARLDLKAEQVEAFSSELSSLLTYIDQLSELKTEGIEPTAHVEALSTPLREDLVTTSSVSEAVLEQAPARSDTLFEVPKVL